MTTPAGAPANTYEQLPREALRHANLHTLATAVPVILGSLALAIFVDIDWLAFIAQWLLLPACVAVTLLDLVLVNRLQYRAYRFATTGTTGTTVEIERGVVVRSRTMISAVQILSVDIVQGPLHRICGVAVVSFSTVGGVVRLGPLAPTVAERVRADVMRSLESVP